MGAATFINRIADLVITSGTAISRWVNGDHETADAVAIVIHSPAVLDVAHDFIIQGSHDNGTTIFDLYTPEATPVQVKAPSTALRCTTYFEIPALLYWRIKDATGNVAATRTFVVTKLPRP